MISIIRSSTLISSMPMLMPERRGMSCRANGLPRRLAKAVRELASVLMRMPNPVSYTHLRAHETRHDLVCRLLLEKKKTQIYGCDVNPRADDRHKPRRPPNLKK